MCDGIGHEEQGIPPSSCRVHEVVVSARYEEISGERSRADREIVGALRCPLEPHQPCSRSGAQAAKH